MNGGVGLVIDTLVCLRFWSRLPTPVLSAEKDPHGFPDFARITRMLPVAGAVIGAVGALVLLGARGVGLPGPLAAGLALAALVIATGAFHEDGLADSADGLGGGYTRQRKLEIMKDSRIGTFGGAALVLSLGLRWQALVTLDAMFGSLGAAAAMVAVAGLSRVAGLVPAVALEPARADGAAQAAGAPSTASFAVAIALSVFIAMACMVVFVGLAQLLIAVVAAFAAAGAMTLIARRHIGGQTGDIAGASQQLAEIAFLLTLATSLL